MKRQTTPYPPSQEERIFRFNRWLSTDDGQRCMEDLAEILGVHHHLTPEESFTQQLEERQHPHRVPIDPVAFQLREGRKSVYWLLRGFQAEAKEIGIRMQKELVREQTEGPGK